ncbi:sterol desaturase family protein [Phenylobacterium sp.]|uniref:sterol desaturase family protein n=1 Tax=Phenylobacterium sp. TaxID=1871053 RepID=UPI00374D61FB
MMGSLAAHQHVLTYLIQGFRSASLLVFIVAAFAPLEHFFAVRPAKMFHPGWLLNVGWYFVNGLSTVLLLGPPTALVAWAVHSLLPTAFTDAAGALPLAIRMIAAMVVGEIGFYWGHRLSHEWPLLWRFHAIHHSATHISVLVNARGHPVDIVFTRLCGLVLLYATGLASPVGPHPTLIPALVLFVGSLWSYFIHANVRWRLGFFEEVLASPAFHHWHHTLEDHKDRNYAAMLPVMDRVFGTFYLPEAWPEAYGTSTPVPDDLIGQLLNPFTAPPVAQAPPA